MNNRIPSIPSHPRPASPASIQEVASGPNAYIPSKPKVLSPGEWMRAVSGVEVPFGFDRMPTVFG